MVTWLRPYLVALFLAMVLAGGWLGFSEWQALRKIDNIMSDGQAVTALIEGAQSVERKSLLSYAVDLAWRDKTGKLFRAKQVSISTAFADQIISNGQLVVPTVAIRYLHGSNEQIDAVATADADRQRGRARAIGYFGAVIALIGLIGAIVFGFNWVRRFGRGRAV